MQGCGKEEHRFGSDDAWGREEEQDQSAVAVISYYLKCKGEKRPETHTAGQGLGCWPR